MSSVENLIRQLELALDKIDSIGESMAAIRLDECIQILCTNHNVKRKRAPGDE